MLVVKVACFGEPGLPVDLMLWDTMDVKGKMLLTE
jgi:hypothetical protein